MLKQKIPDVDITGKTVIVTGANTGIGKETARELLRRGARVILACRNQSRGDAARDEIVKETGKANAIVKILDLGSLASVKAFADDFNQNEERLDILINNAGVTTNQRQQTSDGFEMMFGVNHLGHFYLTNLLLDKLKASAPSRIVIVSSLGHTYAKVDFKNLQSTGRFNNLKIYSKSKTANILHAVQLAKMLEGTGVTTYALHPGAVKTELTRDYGTDSCLVKCVFCVMSMLGEKTLEPPEGALTSLYCSLEPSIAEHSGRYYVRRKEKAAKGYATNLENAQKLWDVSEELVASVMTPK